LIKLQYNEVDSKNIRHSGESPTMIRHSGEGRNLIDVHEIPACAGMTAERTRDSGVRRNDVWTASNGIYVPYWVS
jgi:hypothetical protein